MFGAAVLMGIGIVGAVRMLYEIAFMLGLLAVLYAWLRQAGGTTARLQAELVATRAQLDAARAELAHERRVRAVLSRDAQAPASPPAIPHAAPRAGA